MSSKEISEIFKVGQELLSRGEPFAIVSVTEYKGHSSRHEGAMMLVRKDGTIAGTVGGSVLEKYSIEKALEYMKSGKNGIISIESTSELGMLCGGAVTLYIKSIPVPDTLIIFGAGHVAYQLSKLASQVGFRIIVVDDRPEWASRERFPEASEIVVEKPSAAVQKLPSGDNTYVTIMSYSGDIEKEALKSILDKEYRYIGLIASPVKAIQFLDYLSAYYSLEKLSRIISPMGLDIGGGEEPVDVAMSIVAELQMIRHGATGRQLNRVPELIAKLNTKQQLKA
ncbi:MAG: XdhC/CoxI family protein [Thaumarchaeota archaeon]|jgi:xanthine dehydrogenase accessory factor|nr:XdhC/CoxI family protein [Nitrososphaerota archaeon]